MFQRFLRRYLPLSLPLAAILYRFALVPSSEAGRVADPVPVSRSEAKEASALYADVREIPEEPVYLLLLSNGEIRVSTEDGVLLYVCKHPAVSGAHEEEMIAVSGKSALLEWLDYLLF